MTDLQLIEEDIKTLEAEKMIIRICRDHLNGLELDDIISKYVFEMKGAIRERRQDNCMVSFRQQPEQRSIRAGKTDETEKAYICAETFCFDPATTKYGVCERHESHD